jgi:hypothetical protein
MNSYEHIPKPGLDARINQTNDALGLHTTRGLKQGRLTEKLKVSVSKIILITIKMYLSNILYSPFHKHEKFYVKNLDEGERPLKF